MSYNPELVLPNKTSASLKIVILHYLVGLGKTAWLQYLVQGNQLYNSLGGGGGGGEGRGVDFKTIV